MENPVPLGSIVVRIGYSESSRRLFDKYSKIFPEMTCLCKTNYNELWVIEEFLTNSIVMITKKEDQTKFTICNKIDLATLESNR